MQCPECGSTIPPEAADGPCPSCLVRLGLAMSALDATAGDARRSAGTAAIGSYRIVRLLGEGGMGLVYLAEQTVPIRREVALKIIKPGASSSHVLARFESERQALAMLQHPGIAAIFEAGTTPEGRPFFAMEYVPGVAITTYCDDQRLPVAERLALFLQVCAAVQHAHQKGIIHRDLKPSNILVTQRDDQPFVKIIDFGVAKALAFKLTERTLNTQLGLVLGTPEYMSPEQAGATRFDVDTRTDVYSLGVVLYELLAGAKPFERQDLHAAAVLELMRVLREVEPPRLTTRISNLGEAAGEIARRRQTDARTLARQLHGDLEWITLRTLEKDPARRYAAVSELAGDVRRHLQDEPLTIGPPSIASRVSKFGKRHRALTFAAGALVVSMLVASVVSSIFWIRAERAQRELNSQLVSAMVARGMALVDAADPLRGLVYLTHALRLEQNPERHRAHRLRIAAVRDRTPRLMRLWNHGSPLGSSGFDSSSDGTIATGGVDGIARLWNVEEAGVRRTIRHGAGIIVVDLTDDGRLLLTAGEDGFARLWQTASGEAYAALPHQGIRAATISPDGRFVATGSGDGTLKVWDLATRAPLCDVGYTPAPLPPPPGGVRYGIRTIRFASDSQRLVTALEDGSIRVWALPRCVSPFPMLHHNTNFPAAGAAFSPDDRWIVTAAPDKTVRIWDARSGSPATPPLRLTDNPIAFAFGRDSTLLWTTTVDQMTTVWRLPEGSAVLTRQGNGVPSRLDVSAHGMFATGSVGGDVEVWSGGGTRIATFPHATPSYASFVTSGRLLATAGRDGLVRVWDLAPALPRTPAIQVNEGDQAYRLMFSPDAKSLAVSSLGDGSVRVFDVESGAPLGPSPDRPTIDFEFSPDGTQLVIATPRHGRARVWDVRTSEPRSPAIAHARLMRVRFSPDGRTVASAGGPDPSGDLKVWDAASGQMRFPPAGLDGPIASLEFSADGRRLFTATTLREGNLILRDAATGRIEAKASHGLRNSVEVARIDNSGRQIWTVGDDQQIRVWTLSNDRLDPAPKLLLGSTPSVLRLSPDNRTVAVGTNRGDIRIIDLRTSEVRWSPMRHTAEVYGLQYSPDGSIVVTSAGDGMARAWDVETGEPLTSWLTTGVQFPRSAAVASHGRSWAYVGDGAFLERLETADEPIERLVRRAELEAAATFAASTVPVPLSAADIDARWQSDPPRDASHDPGLELWLMWLARFEWRQGHGQQSLNALHELRTIRALRWPEVMQQLAALASTGEWTEVLRELEAHRAWYAGAPELLFFEAIARRQLGDRESVAASCRRQLGQYAGTESGERATWIVHTCLLAGPGDGVDWEAVTRLTEHVSPIWRDRISREVLRSAIFVRLRQFEKAIAPLRRSTTTEAAGSLLTAKSLLGYMFLGLAEAGTGNATAASATLAQARNYRPNPAETGSWYRPWFTAEAELIRAEVIAALEGR